MEAAFDVAPEGAKRCIHRYHRLSNLGTQMNRIIELAGIASWPKTFQNLRATRRTELQERYQDHVVNAWLGHSSKTAEKHYLQVTDDHWDAGTSLMTGAAIDLEAKEPDDVAVSGGVRGGVISAPLGPSRSDANEKAPAIPGSDGSGGLQMMPLATPQGLEP